MAVHAQPRPPWQTPRRRRAVSSLVTAIVAVGATTAAAQFVPGVPGPLIAQVAGNAVTLTQGASFPPPGHLRRRCRLSARPQRSRPVRRGPRHDRAGGRGCDRYSSINVIPCTPTGLANGVTVFTHSATVPVTFGTFATVANPSSTTAIDTLVIAVGNPQCTRIQCSNPVGVDHVVWP